MKQLMMICMFAVSGMLFSTSAAAQNGNGNGGNNGNGTQIEREARSAAEDAGCLDGINGKVSYSTTIIGGCACGPATTCARYEVVIFSYVKPKDLPFTLPQRLATVTICASGDVDSVTCDGL